MIGKKIGLGKKYQRQIQDIVKGLRLTPRPIRNLQEILKSVQTLKGFLLDDARHRPES